MNTSVDHFRYVIQDILNSRRFAVVGASRDKQKYGYMVYRTLKDAGYTVYPVNPNAETIDGEDVYPLLDNCPERPDCVVTVVQPEVTFEIVRRSGHLHIPYMWLQPGSESLACINEIQAQGIQAVYGGPCVMVAVRTHPKPEWMHEPRYYSTGGEIEE
jgi:predicted CoA-binding protein